MNTSRDREMRCIRRGSAMPMVIFGMAVAIGLATLAWNRSWSRRTTSAHADLAWQSQLLAESGTACALQEALARAGAPKKDTSTIKDSAKKSIVTIRDTTDTACVFHGTAPGEMSWDQPAGTQLLTIRATGTVLESGEPFKTTMRSTWGGNPPVDPFSPAISLWDNRGNSLQLSGTVQGQVRVNFATAPPGTVKQKTGGIDQFVPTSIASDTSVAVARMNEAFRSPDASWNGCTFTPQRPPEANKDSLICTGETATTVFDAPWAGDPWDAGRPRILFSEGRLELRGKLRMRGWTIYSKGTVVIQDDAEVSNTSIFSAGGVRVADRAKFSGQILSSGTVALSEDARMIAPSFVACWPTKGRDSVPRFVLSNQARAEAYVVALGANAQVGISRGARLRGVAVSGSSLRNEGRIEGLAVAVRLDCGQGDNNCSNGTFLRNRLPVDFAFPLGLPGSSGYRLVSWATGE